MWMYQAGMPSMASAPMPTIRAGTSSTAFIWTRMARSNSGLVSPDGSFSFPRRPAT